MQTVIIHACMSCSHAAGTNEDENGVTITTTMSNGVLSASQEVEYAAIPESNVTAPPLYDDVTVFPLRHEQQVSL